MSGRLTTLKQDAETNVTREITTQNTNKLLLLLLLLRQIETHR